MVFFGELVNTVNEQRAKFRHLTKHSDYRLKSSASRMQSFCLKSNRRVNGMRLKLALAARSPNRHIVGFVKKDDNESCEPQLMPLTKGQAAADGCCLKGEVSVKFTEPERVELLKMVRKLLHVLHIAKQLYKLSDAETLGLLKFFDWNISHVRLNIKGSHRTLTLDIDVPWQYASKTPSEIMFRKIFAEKSIYNSDFSDRVYIPREHIWRCLVNQKFYAIKQPNRLRIQRCYHNDREFQAICLLPTQHSKVEVIALLLPCASIKQAAEVEQLVAALSTYIAPLLLISKMWEDQELRLQLQLQCQQPVVLQPVLDSLRSLLPCFSAPLEVVGKEPEDNQYYHQILTAEAYMAIAYEALLQIVVQNTTIVYGIKCYNI